MRRQLEAELPLLMSVYPGLKPWDLPEFTRGELERLLAAARRSQEGADGR